MNKASSSLATGNIAASNNISEDKATGAWSCGVLAGSLNTEQVILVRGFLFIVFSIKGI